MKIRLGIYIKNEDDVWINSLEPVGNYIRVYDFGGTFIDELISIESREKRFGIEYWIEILNKAIPEKYYKRNTPQYEFVTYISHTFSLFQGRNFKRVFIFLKRCVEYLENQKNRELLDKLYLEQVREYLISMYFYLKNNKLIEKDKIEKYDIKGKLNHYGLKVHRFKQAD